MRFKSCPEKIILTLCWLYICHYIFCDHLKLFTPTTPIEMFQLFSILT